MANSTNNGTTFDRHGTWTPYDSIILDFIPLPPTKPQSPPSKPSMFSSKEQAQNTASQNIGDVRFASELDAEGPLVGDIIKRHHNNTTSAEFYFLFRVRSCAASACGATSNTSKPACKPGGSLPAWPSAALKVVSTVASESCLSLTQSFDGSHVSRF